MRVRPDLESQICDIITNVIIKYWYCFFKEGAWRPILDYNFIIDTGTVKPVCCCKYQYGPHEPKIITLKTESLILNGLIEECGGPWGIIIVLAENPHQENVTNIEYFIWCM